MKKRTALLLVGLLTVGMLGCGNKAENVENAEATENVVVEETTTNSEEAENVNPAISELDNMEQYVELNDYKNMTVAVSKTEVTDEAVITYINSYLLSTYEVTDRAVEEGDIAVIDFTGYKDGEAFEGGASEGYQLQIGSGSFIPGFEDGLVGVMPGETVDLDLTFPENYQSTDLAGQAVVFTVTVNSILATADYDSVTEELLVAMGSEYKTKQELWDAAVAALEANYEELYQNDISNAALLKILEEANFGEVPAYLVDEALASNIEYQEMVCNYYYGTDLETFVSTYYQMSLDEYKESIRPEIEDEIKQELAMEAIGRDLGLVPTEDEVLKEAQDYVDNYGYESIDELFEAGGGKASFVTFITQNRVMDYLQNNVTVVEAE